MAIYLALYKGEENWKDRIIRFFTRGKYSHCELAVHKVKLTDRYSKEERYECYTSSPRDGGVRTKQINVGDSKKWDLIPLDGVSEQQIKEFFAQTKGNKYDLLGAIGAVLGNKQSKSKFFCSEWCWEAIGGQDGWRFSPNDLATIFRKDIK